MSRVAPALRQCVTSHVSTELKIHVRLGSDRPTELKLNQSKKTSMVLPTKLKILNGANLER